MISVKVIKPQRLKIDAMRLELLTGLHEAGRDTIKEYEKTVSTWNNPPKFEALISLMAPGATLVVGPVGNDEAVQHYEWVDKGTRRHWVEPVKAKALYFQGSYKAKSVPNVIGSFTGGASGEFFYSKGHWVSGIEPRNFDKVIQEKMTPQFKRRMEEAMRRAAKASGHGV
jgi:hypothetical protein